MKKYLLFLGVMALCTSISAQKQKRGGMDKEAKKERFESMKVAHLTKELDLTSQQAEQFWPIYNSYQDKKKQLREGMRVKKIDEMSDAEAKEFLNRSKMVRSQSVALDEQMDAELADLLSAKQILKLHRAEKEFHKEVVKRYKKKRRKAHKAKDQPVQSN